jgi:hypothetical protein
VLIEKWLILNLKLMGPGWKIESRPRVQGGDWRAGDLARFRWRAPWPRGKVGDVRVSTISRLHFRRLMIRLNIPVLTERKPDKPEHDQDGSSNDHPVRIFHRGEHPVISPSPLPLSFIAP